MVQLRGDGPLGIKTGSVRAFLAIISNGVWTFVLVMAVLGWNVPSDILTAVTAANGAVNGFYFGSRGGEIGENGSNGNGNGNGNGAG